MDLPLPPKPLRFDECIRIAPTPVQNDKIPLHRFGIIDADMRIAANDCDKRLNNIILTLRTEYGATREIPLNDLILKQYHWLDDTEAINILMALQDSIGKLAFYYKKMHLTNSFLGRDITFKITSMIGLDKSDTTFCEHYYVSYQCCLVILTCILKALTFGIHSNNLATFGNN